MKKIFACFMLLLSLSCFGQKDTTRGSGNRYILHDAYPFYHFCKNCNQQSGRLSMLCGHRYRAVFAGYSYDGGHWAELGYARDKTNCFPEKGTDFFAASLLVRPDTALIAGLKLTYLRDNVFGLQFYFLKYGLNVEAYSDFRAADLALRPEIRISDNMDYSTFFSRINIAYGYNFQLTRNLTIPRRTHQLTLIIYLFRRGPIS